MERYLLNKYHSEESGVNYYDQCYLSHVARLAEEKTHRRIEQTKNKIHKLKHGSCRKYQVLSKYEITSLEQFCTQNGIHSRIVYDDKLTNKRINHINETYSDGHIIYQPTFIYDQVPRMYLYVQK